MKRIAAIFCMITFVCGLTSAAFAGWNSCVGCHNGSLAPDKAKLIEKHKTRDAFIKAAKAVQNPLMQSIKNDDKALQDAAREIGLK